MKRIKTYSVSILITLVSLSCHQKLNAINSERHPTLLTLIKNYPWDKYYGKGVMPDSYCLPDSIKIISDGNYTLIKLSEPFNPVTSSRIIGASPYFFYRNNDDTGFYYLNIREDKFMKVSVSKVLNQIRRDFSEQLNLSDSYWNECNICVNSMSSKKSKVFTLKAKTENEELVSDTIEVLFSDSMKTTFSLSSKLDSLNLGKVFHIKMKYKEFYSNVLKKKIPEFEFSLKMDEHILSISDIEYKQFQFYMSKYKTR